MIFFAGSSSVLGHKQALYNEIITQIQTLGYDVLDSWIVDLLNDKEGCASREQVLERQQKLLRQADYMVVECTSPSLGIGYLMYQAIHERTPILCLYDASLGNDELSDMIIGNHSTLITLIGYEPTNVGDPIKAYFASPPDDNLYKFNFLATKEILVYIEEGALSSGLSKSDFLRGEIKKRLISKNK